MEKKGRKQIIREGRRDGERIEGKREIRKRKERGKERALVFLLCANHFPLVLYHLVISLTWKSYY